MFQMKEEYKIGIPNIDAQHEKLFEIGERAFQLLKEKYTNDKFDKIVEIIEELKAYTIYHFRDEEEYMESINYKRLFTQKIEHENFVKTLDGVNLSKIDENQDEAIMKILNYLNEWLISHIVEKDMLIGK